MRCFGGLVVRLWLVFSLGIVIARGEIVFDNSVNYQTHSFPSLFEYGDELILAGTARTVTNFTFEYFGDFPSHGDETARIRFYANDGPGPTANSKAPGSLLFDSGPFVIFSGQNSAPIEGLDIRLPDKFTWTVQFGGVSGTAGDQAGLIFYYPVTVGRSFRDFWMNEGGLWKLKSFPNFDPVANFGALVAATPSDVWIRGAITYYAGQLAVGGTVLSVSGSQSLTVNNAADGTYEILVDAGGNYAVSPARTSDSSPNRGVSSFDIALMRRHILNTALLDSPYKIIAADANGSQSVSSFDIALMRRLILGTTNNLPAGLWKFVRSDFVFANPQIPWSHEAARSYTGINTDVSAQDFIAIKVGDVNGSWTAPAASPAALAHFPQHESAGAAAGPIADYAESAEVEFEPAHRGSRSSIKRQSVGKSSGAEPRAELQAVSAVTFAVSDEVAQPDGAVTVSCRVTNFSRINSFQFTLQWNPAILQFVAANDFVLPGSGSFGTTQTNEGKLTVLWDDEGIDSGVTVADGALVFTVQFNAATAPGVISPVAFSDNPTVREVIADLTPAALVSRNGAVAVGDITIPNLPPTVSAIANQSMLEDTATGAIAFVIQDVETPASELTLDVNSSNPNLVPNSNIAFDGTGTNRTLTVTPLRDKSGTATITVTVTDSRAVAASTTFTLLVLPVNDPPVALDLSAVAFEDQSKPIALLGHDVENSPLTYTLISPPTKGALTGTPPNVTYRPSLNETGADSFTFKVNDGERDSNPATVRVTLTPVNDAPVAINVNFSTAEDTPGVITLAGSDIEGDSLSYRVLSFPANGTLSGSLTNLVYTPHPETSGPDSFTFRASDGDRDSSPATINITVTPVNDVPTISEIPDQIVSQTTPILELAFTATDVETPGADLTVAGTSSNTNLVAPEMIIFGGTNSARTVRLETAPGQGGSAVITVTVADAEGLSVSETFSVTVLRPEPAPARLEPPGRRADGNVRLTFMGEAGIDYVLEGSTNLTAWLPLSESTGTGALLEFIDSPGTNLVHRFYRIRAQ